MCKKIILAAFAIAALFIVTACSSSIPGEGGSVNIRFFETEVAFTPEESGLWMFRTTNNGFSDPVLHIYNEDGYLIGTDDDGAGDFNALVLASLVAGREYTIYAEFFGFGLRYTLDVLHNPAEDDLSAGSIRVEEPGLFRFVPDSTGVWTFETSDSGRSDPFLAVYGAAGNEIGFDDDAGEELNAYLQVFMRADTPYYIWAGFFNGGAYTLNVSLADTPGLLPDEQVTVSRPGYWSFVPDATGFWKFETLSDGDFDPFLTLFCADWVIAEDDDSGAGFNARILAHLEAGSQYFIHAGFFDFFDGDGYELLARFLPADAHRQDSPLWAVEERFHNNDRYFAETNGEWEQQIRQMFIRERGRAGRYRGGAGYDYPTNPAVNDDVREVLRQAFADDTFFRSFPFNQAYLDEIILPFLEFYFVTDRAGMGGWYLGEEEVSTIFLDLGRDDDALEWATAVFGHEIAHALGLGESLADLFEEVLMGWNYSSQGYRSYRYHPLEFSNIGGLVYNSTFDRTLKRFAGAEAFWHYAFFSDHAYGELWDTHLGHIVAFRDMQLIRNVMWLRDFHPQLAYYLEQQIGNTIEEMSERLLAYWRTILIEAHPTNDYGITPPTEVQQSIAQQNFNELMGDILAFASIHHIAPVEAVFRHVHMNHHARTR